MMKRRSLLTWMSAGFVGVFAASAASLVRSLGAPPGPSLYDTVWKPGQRLMTAAGTPVSVDALQPGSTMLVFPEDSIGDEKAQTVLLRVNEQFLRMPRERADWAPHGYLAYSRICTHAGCPVGLYQKETHLLVCPCHQSSFDVLKGAEPTGRAGQPGAAAGAAVRGCRWNTARKRRVQHASGTWILGDAGMIEWLGRMIGRWLDRRVGGAKFLRRALNHVFPDHWSFMLGEIALYCFIILVAHRGLSNDVFPRQLHQGGLSRVLQSARWIENVGRLHIGVAHQLRCKSRPSYPPNAPLGGFVISGRYCHSCDADLLHRGISPATRDQLADRPDALGACAGQRLLRILAAGRSSVWTRFKGRLFHRSVGPGDRRLAGISAVRQHDTLACHAASVL